MIALVWGVKESLRAYVRGTADGGIRCLGDAVPVGDVFAFPLASREAGVWRFSGGLVLSGHGGMLHVELAHPHLEVSHDRATLTVDDDGGRLAFARLTGVRIDGSTLTAAEASLTADGSDLFFGPYAEGTPLDVPRVVDLPSA